MPKTSPTNQIPELLELKIFWEVFPNSFEQIECYVCMSIVLNIVLLIKLAGFLRCFTVLAFEVWMHGSTIFGRVKLIRCSLVRLY